MEIEKKIQKLIKHKMEDSFVNHLKSPMYWSQWCGSLFNNEFIVWKNGRWNGPFYPLIKGRIIENEVKLSYALNPIGKILLTIWLLILPIWIVSKPLEVLISGGGNALLVLVVIAVFLCTTIASLYFYKKIIRISIKEFSDFLKK